jgi:hypothetical protein
MNIRSTRLAALSLLLWLSAMVVPATMAFTYQGRSHRSGHDANGNYDLQFALFDNVARGSNSVSAGIFTVQLDFGASAFTSANRFLEMLSAMLVGILPSNIYSAINHIEFGGHAAGPAYLLIRVPFQLFVIWWVYVATEQNWFRRQRQRG